MSVEPSESLSEVWTRWQGELINATFPLGRFLGSSDHSGAFLTRASARGPADVAIKLVPTNRALAELLLPRWKRAGSLAHSNVLPLLQWGGCQLEGLPYLYALMEYADQTLAELLASRALTDEEAREMLVPTLDALAYLHRQDLVQGQLKPANILVVGDQLKLASDTARRLSEGATSTHPPTAYDPPEARQGSTSPAGDIWALGVTLCEALTRRLPSGLNEAGEVPVLPADFSPVFRDIVTRCLSLNPLERPGLKELAAFARGQSAEFAQGAASEPQPLERSEPMVDSSAAAETMATEQKAAEAVTSEATSNEAVTLEPVTAAPMTGETVTIEALTPEPPTPEPPTPEAPTPEATTTGTETPEAISSEGPTAPSATSEAVIAAPLTTERVTAQAVSPEPGQTAAAPPEEEEEEEEPAQRPPPVGAILGVLVIIGVVWAGVRMLGGHSAPAPPLPPVQAPVAPAAEQVAAPVSAGSISREAASEATRSSVHEVIPDVPAGARRSIRGHIKVWVRVIVNRDGSVFAATPDRTGSSRYFERLALEAAKKWTFPPAEAPSQRLVQIHFDFSREGVTARAVTLR